MTFWGFVESESWTSEREMMGKKKKEKERRFGRRCSKSALEWEMQARDS